MRVSEVTQIGQTRRGKLPSADSMAAVLLAETWFRDPQGIIVMLALAEKINRIALMLVYLAVSVFVVGNVV